MAHSKGQNKCTDTVPEETHAMDLLDIILKQLSYIGSKK